MHQTPLQASRLVTAFDRRRGGGSLELVDVGLSLDHDVARVGARRDCETAYGPRLSLIKRARLDPPKHVDGKTRRPDLVDDVAPERTVRRLEAKAARLAADDDRDAPRRRRVGRRGRAPKRPRRRVGCRRVDRRAMHGGGRGVGRSRRRHVGRRAVGRSRRRHVGRAVGRCRRRRACRRLGSQQVRARFALGRLRWRRRRRRRLRRWWFRGRFPRRRLRGLSPRRGGPAAQPAANQHRRELAQRRHSCPTAAGRRWLRALGPLQVGA
mmetsp:Transcript_28183/g.97046  ORF Transcript_28183/g.97046 Transcript_28183/m.97046 type:complete len:267 (-) Transcript_28183:8-808(-)